MSARKTTEAIDQDRRGLLGTAMTAIAVAGTASLISANPVRAADSFGNPTSKQKESTVDTTKETAIRPFTPSRITLVRGYRTHRPTGGSDLSRRAITSPAPP